MFLKYSKKEIRAKKRIIANAKEKLAARARNKRKRYVFAIYSDNMLPSFTFCYGHGDRYGAVKRYLKRENLGEIKLRSVWADNSLAKNCCMGTLEKAVDLCNGVLKLGLDFKVLDLEKWVTDMMSKDG